MNRLFCILLAGLLSITASVAATYSLYVEVTPVGGGSLNTTGGAVEEGQSVYLYTYPNTGYVFKGWYDGETLLSSSTNFYYTMPQRDATVQARYEFDPTVPANPSMPDTVTYYTLKANVEPVGAASLNIYEGRFAYDAKVDIYAYGNSGYRFLGWQDREGTRLSDSPSFRYTMPRHDSELTAMYEFDPSVPANPDSMATQYTVYVASKPMGAGSFNSSAITSAEGSTVRIYAYTNTGYRFLHWEDEQGHVITADQTFEYTMPHGNSMVYGVFEFDPDVPGNPNKNYWNKELGDLIVDDFRPGRLIDAVSSAIYGSDYGDVTMITVAGTMTDNDFGVVNYCGNCTLLDLSRVTGVGTVPSYAFDRTLLESVYLPSTIERIGYRAFDGCSQLSALTVYAMTPPVLESDVFRGVPEGLVVYVPAGAVDLYRQADGWKDFVILPVQDNIRTITIALPSGSTPSDFTGLWLELINSRNGQRLHYVMTDRATYTFPNIIDNTTWSVVVRNERGDVFGRINEIQVGDEDVMVAFDALSRPHTVTMVILTDQGLDVTDRVQISWTDESGSYIGQGPVLRQLPKDAVVTYTTTLSKDLCLQYANIGSGSHTVTDAGNTVAVSLAGLEEVEISGMVVDKRTDSPLTQAVVNLAQTYGGKYSRSMNMITDEAGMFRMTVKAVPTVVTLSASDYISQKIDSLEFAGAAVDLGTIALQPLTGQEIMAYHYSHPSVTAGEDDSMSEYTNTANITYEIVNATTGRPIESFTVKQPRIILHEHVDDGDVLLLTASSKSGDFNPVATEVAVTGAKTLKAVFEFTELGGIMATYTSSDKVDNQAMLYDAGGTLAVSVPYIDGQATFSALPDGAYTLVSMCRDPYYNATHTIDRLAAMGLSADRDYVAVAVNVRSGFIRQVNIDNIPAINRPEVQYTGSNTSFTVNKPTVLAGNYVTLTAHLDFKAEYAQDVENVKISVSLPDKCSLVPNSVILESALVPYDFEDNVLTVSTPRYGDRLRFCVMPLEAADYTPTAMAQFDIDGHTLTQPIGSATFSAENISIECPETTIYKEITVHGMARPNCDVLIYDNGILAGQTRSLANGSWSEQIELVKPYNASVHDIYVSTVKDGLRIDSESSKVVYDANACQINRIVMNYQSDIVFDFVRNIATPSNYSYVPGRSKFTFLAEFSDADPERIIDAQIAVLLSDNTYVELDAEYDSNHNGWVATEDFTETNALPVNCDVIATYEAKTVENDEMYSDDLDLFEQAHSELYDALQTAYDAALPSADTEQLLVTQLNSDIYDEHYDINVEVIPVDGLSPENMILEEDEDGPQIYYIDEITEHGYVLTVAEVDFSMAWRITIPIKGDLPASRYQVPDWLRDHDWINYIPVPYLGYLYNVFVSYNHWKDRFPSDVDELFSANDRLSKLLHATCADGTPRLTKDQKIQFLKEMDGNVQAIGNFANTGYALLEEWRKALIRSYWFETATIGLGKVLKLVPNIKVFYSNGRGSGMMGYLVKGGKKNRLRWEKYLEWGAGAISPVSSLINDLLGNNMNEKFSNWEPSEKNRINRMINDMANRIKDSYLKCPKKPTPKPRPKKPKFPIPPLHPSVDPSGFVYEAVESNRLEGVTATAYYKEMVEDMYGDLYENIVKWDAEEYAQENPLFTDENGMYAWDVPQGLWQVKFEKEGYETTYSEWLPVPPPQLEVNVGMRQNVQPSVRQAHAYESAVEVEFDKYMVTELLTTDNIIVQVDGRNVDGSVVLLDSEASYTQPDVAYASRARFEAAEPFEADEITLIVNNRVKSYAGVRMQDDFMQTFTVEREIRQIVCDSVLTVVYGDTVIVPVAVVPAEASAGRSLTVRSSSGMILSVEREELTIDEEGMAYMVLVGQLPGTASVYLSVADSKLSAQVEVNVVKLDEATVAAPVASIASGSVVEKGTEVTLSCGTEGAVIYYTTDGSCPCELETALVYEGPIVIDESVTILAMAVKDGLYDSEVVEFVYTVSDGDGIVAITTDDDLRLYPLPMRGTLNITASGATITHASVVALNGATCLSVSRPAKEIRLNVEALTPGVYIINVATSDAIYRRKVLKVE